MSRFVDNKTWPSGDYGGDEMASSSALQVQVSICMASVDLIAFYLANPDQSRAEFYSHSQKKRKPQEDGVVKRSTAQPGNNICVASTGTVRNNRPKQSFKE